MGFRRLRFAAILLALLFTNDLWSQHHPISVGVHIEPSVTTINAGLTIAYHFNKVISAQLEIRNRSLGLGNLEDPCLILNPETYPDLAFMDPGKERIIMLPKFSGSAPLSLGFEVKSRRRFGPFFRLRGEVVRYNFNVTTARQTVSNSSWFGPIWLTGRTITHDLTAHRVAGSVQTGLSITSKEKRLTFKVYIGLDAFSTSNVEVFMPIPRYPEIEPVKVSLSDHFGEHSVRLGGLMFFNFGAKWIGKTKIED